MLKTLGSSVRRNWIELDGPLKLSVAMGLLSVPALSIFYAYLLSQFGAGASLSEIALIIFFLLFFPAGILTVPSILAFAGAIMLLFRPMTLERRGVLGFIVFFASIPSILIVLYYSAYLWGLWRGTT